MTVTSIRNSMFVHVYTQKDLSPWSYEGANLVVFQMVPGPHFVCIMYTKIPM